MVKNLLPMQEMRVPSLVWEDPLEKEMGTHSNILAWDISLAESLGDHSPWGHRVRHDLATCNAGDAGSIPGSGRSAEEGIGYALQYSWA